MDSSPYPVPPSPSAESLKSTSNALGRPGKRMKRRRKDPSTSSSSLDLPTKDQFIQLIGVVIVAAFVAFSVSRFAKWSALHSQPFCDTASDPYHSQDSCIPCPANGICSAGNLECLPGYKRHRNICMENLELEEKAHKLAKLIESFACGQHAQSICNGAGIIWFHDKDLEKELKKHFEISDFNLHNIEIPLLEKKVMDIVYNMFEKQKRFDGSFEFKCPRLLAEQYISVRCWIREWISYHYKILFIGFVVIIMLAKYFYGIHSNRRIMKRAEQLYQQVCEVLEEKAVIEKSKGSEGKPWVVGSLLRDHLLVPGERKNSELWKKVEEFIREDSRIDQYPKVVKGESKIVLEWQVEGALHSRKRFEDAKPRIPLSEFGNDDHRVILV